MERVAPNCVKLSSFVRLFFWIRSTSLKDSGKLRSSRFGSRIQVHADLKQVV